MMNLVFSPTPDEEAAEQYRQAALSPNTRKTYDLFWRKFVSWCEAEGEQSLPTSTEVIARYLASIGASTKFTSLQIAISAIKHMHKEAQVAISGDTAAYQAVHQGIRRTHPENQGCNPKPHITAEMLYEAIPKIPATLKGLRDKAMILLAFFTGCRRSEIAALDAEHVELVDGGLRVTILRSKTCDTAQYAHVDAMPNSPICPVEAINAWKQAAFITAGPLFLSFRNSAITGRRIEGEVLSYAIKKYFGPQYAGHSTRSGMATEMAKARMPIHEIMALTRHKSADCVLRYMRAATGFDHTVAKGMKKGQNPQ